MSEPLYCRSSSCTLSLSSELSRIIKLTLGHPVFTIRLEKSNARNRTTCTTGAQEEQETE